MLKRLVNEARFKLTITAKRPLLVKSGHPTLIGPDMTPVLTYRNGESQVYLPGSSLKGVFRSHVEKVVRTIRQGEIVVCDPFLTAKKAEEKHLTLQEQNCGDWFKQIENAPKNSMTQEEFVYNHSCPACRLFGSTFFIGRVNISDACLVDESDPRPTETRDGVGIDRLTGGAADKAKFDLEVVSSETAFVCDVLLRNFECWQLGALLLVLQDMNDGLVFIGSGKSRGLGAAKASVNEITLAHIGRNERRTDNEIWGLGKFLDLEKNLSYRTLPDDVLQIEQAPTSINRGVRQLQTFSMPALTNLQEKAIEAFLKCMEFYPLHKAGASA